MVTVVADLNGMTVVRLKHRHVLRPHGDTRGVVRLLLLLVLAPLVDLLYYPVSDSAGSYVVIGTEFVVWRDRATGLVPSPGVHFSEKKADVD
jgi:hypothetical protein